MTWQPISKAEILDLISVAQARMNRSQGRLWASIQIQPEKWHLHPEGDQGDGFWAVALMGRTVVWYNDIEDGFDISPYSKYGFIGQYLCNQYDLEMTIQILRSIIIHGVDRRPYVLGPPESIVE